MATKISLEYFGMPGTGQTVKEAKQDAGRRIEQALEGSYAPVVLSYRGKTLVMHRDPRYGWGYRFAHEPGIMWTADHCSSGFADYEDCLKAAAGHLADLTREEGEYDSEVLSAIPARMGAVLRRNLPDGWRRSDIARSRYRTAKERGMSDADAHSYAWQDPSRADLWSGEGV